MPKIQSVQEIIGSQKFDGKSLCVITGTSSGLGKQTAKALLKTGTYHVIGACRDVDKMNAVADAEGFDTNSFTCLPLDLASFQSVREFVQKLDEFRSGKPVDRLICNAAVYQPSLPYAKFTEDGIEQQMQINYLSHFLLTSLLVDYL